MYGQHVGSLSVFHKTAANIPANPIWIKKGAMVNDWLYGQFVVPNGKFQVQLTASIKNSISKYIIFFMIFFFAIFDP